MPVGNGKSGEKVRPSVDQSVGMSADSSLCPHIFWSKECLKSFLEFDTGGLARESQAIALRY
jgi:hypothetical protein